MVDNAKEHRRSENCEFVVNKRNDLSLFSDDHFDFIFSDITIQHIPAPASENYLQEFVRILRPGGLAIFLVPDGPDLQQGSVKHRIDKFYREQFRPFYKRIRGKHQIQIHPIAKPRVEQLITTAGGQIIQTEIHPRWSEKNRKYYPTYYWVSK